MPQARDANGTMKVAYWCTSSLEPPYEAVSNEIFELASQFPGSWIFSVSPHFAARFSWRKRYAGLNASAYALSRALIPVIEPAFDVSHVYGDASPWLFHRSLHRRPIVHTVTRVGTEPEAGFLRRCEAVVAQTPASRDRLRALGVTDERLHLIYPPVDLTRFRPADGDPPPGPTKILFATAPRSREELSARGAYLLIEAARLRPDLAFRFLYRRWRTGESSHDATQTALEEAGVRNVVLTQGTVGDMPATYREHHFTIIPYLERDGGKECPNSAIESLACGVPLLVSTACPFASFVEEHDCGVVFEPRPDDLMSAIDTGARRWPSLSRAAREAAERFFDARELRARYERLYEQSRTAASPTHEEALDA